MAIEISHFLKTQERNTASEFPTGSQDPVLRIFTESDDDTDFYKKIYLYKRNPFSDLNSKAFGAVLRYGAPLVSHKERVIACVEEWTKNKSQYPHLYCVGIVDKDFGVGEDDRYATLVLTDRHDIETTIGFFYPGLIKQKFLSIIGEESLSAVSHFKKALKSAFELSVLRRYCLQALPENPNFLSDKSLLAAVKHLSVVLRDNDINGLVSGGSDGYQKRPGLASLLSGEDVSPSSFFTDYVDWYCFVRSRHPLSDQDPMTVSVFTNGTAQHPDAAIFKKELINGFNSFASEINFSTSSGEKRPIWKNAGWSDLDLLIPCGSSIDSVSSVDFWDSVTSHDISVFMRYFDSDMNERYRQNRDSIEKSLKNYVVNTDDKPFRKSEMNKKIGGITSKYYGK
jgi:hypothetical protein